MVHPKRVNMKLPKNSHKALGGDHPEIEFENNHCCIKIHNTSDSTVEFLHGQEMAYFDARSKGLVQTNNSKHFSIDQYLHDRMTPATLSPIPLAYEKPVHPAKMQHITTCTELPVDDTNKSTSNDRYPWLYYISYISFGHNKSGLSFV